MYCAENVKISCFTNIWSNFVLFVLLDLRIEMGHGIKLKHKKTKKI